MKTKMILLSSVVAVAIVGVLSFKAGLEQGKKLDKIETLRFNIITDVHLLKLVEANNQEKLKQDLRMLIFSWTEEFKKTGAIVTNADFQARLSEASKISEQTKTNLVSFP